MSTILSLESNITEIKGIGPKKAEAFGRLGIFCIGDFLRNYPREYEDMRNVKLIAGLKDGEKAVVEGTVVFNALGRGYGRKRTLHLSVLDKSAKMEVLFFMAGFMAKQFKNGSKYRFFGKVKVENGSVTMFHPSYEPADSDLETGILPVYSSTRGLSQKDLRRVSKQALLLAADYPEQLPLDVIEKAKLAPIAFALENIHYPTDTDAYKAARYRLVFEELFDLRFALKLSASRFGFGRQGVSFKKGDFSPFIKSLGYNLTSAQERALREIESDMNSELAMNRLLQGDVGSGKTIIAEAALYKAVKAGYQGVFMAPTEILASQHFESFTKDFEAFDINIGYLSGSLGAKDKREVLEKLKSGEIDILIGTHALISGNVEFRKLGLAITDEQHRFGVNQRKKLGDKGDNPDVLVMTATPIPRTLAVVLYSDLDISIIDELPPGRQAIITNRFNEQNRDSAYDKLLSEIEKGRQAYIVAPFIEDSESLQGYSAESLYEEFTRTYPGIKAGLLHGEMKQAEKDECMRAFSAGEISVLISTVVIEVGINVPNATVMLIENAERFGLAQLHQLRGRVGRGCEQSYCFLVLGDESEIALSRAEIMCQSRDGFYIAEKDLELRGPGELFGYRQHGLPQLQLADPVKHSSVLKLASDMADLLYENDPEQSNPDNKVFYDRIYKDYVNSDKLVL